VSHLRVDGEYMPTKGWPRLDRFREHSIELPVAKVVVEPGNEKALRHAVEQALEMGKGVLHVCCGGWGDRDTQIFSVKRACPSCGRSFGELDPRLFSYNSKHGWCAGCYGTGLKIDEVDWSDERARTGTEDHVLDSWVEWLEIDEACPQCEGKRLNKEALAVRFRGQSIADMSAQPISKAHTFFEKLAVAGREQEIARDILTELASRLGFLEQVGLGYLSLDRGARRSPGGEAQRIRLAAQLGSNLRGVCYILDEPTIGLHPRDNQILLDTLARLGAKGNTLVVVEHDEDTIRRAEHVIDLGPGAGRLGGHIVAQGNAEELKANPDSLTGHFLREPLKHPVQPRRAVEKSTPSIEVTGAAPAQPEGRERALPAGPPLGGDRRVGLGQVDARARRAAREPPRPGGRGARPQVRGRDLRREGDQGMGACFTRARGGPDADRQDAALVPGHLRRLLRQHPQALRGHAGSAHPRLHREPLLVQHVGRAVRRLRGPGHQDHRHELPPGREGRLRGVQRRALQRRDARREAARQSIGEVLALSVDEAVDFFENHPSIHHCLRLLQDVGLGYLTLGQQSPTLSGGEAQRIKLVTELAKVRGKQAPRPGRASVALHTLYVLDEPTVGLHMADVEKLIRVLHRLVDAGNSVVLIEHNLDVIAEADWIVDMGPEGGDAGGRVVLAAPPEEFLRASAKTHTARALREFMATHGR
jgi:excinuclease ABC subunit A